MRDGLKAAALESQLGINIYEVMGPDPKAVLNCFTDLGLSDQEIARYFNLHPLKIAIYRQIFKTKRGG